MRAVLDTNVIISAVFFGGEPRRLIKHFFAGDFNAFVSPQIIREYRETYDEIHQKYSARGNPAVLRKIIEKANIVMPGREIAVCRDPDDDKFISCAIEGKCVYIVSGDNDLLSLGKVADVEIITIAAFLRKLEE